MSQSEAIARVLAQLENVRTDGTGWNARCPAHDDQKNSLHVGVGQDGRALLRCHAGCPTQQVVNAAKLSMSDLYVGAPGRGLKEGRTTRDTSTPTFGKIAATYDYVDENGTLAYQVIRDEHKNFRQRRPTNAEPPADLWTYNLEGCRKLLYRLPEVRVAIALQHRIYIVEGEKDADALARLGLTATTNSGGAGKWTEEHTAQLAAASDVVILPDNDRPGLLHARAVRKALRGKVARTSAIHLPNLPDKGDVSNWIAAGGTLEQLQTLASTPTIPKGWVSARELIDLQVPDVDWLVPDLISARSIVIFSGDSGVWKSWLAWGLAVAFVIGGRFVNHFQCRKSRVMIVSADEPFDETRRKLSWISTYHSPNGSGPPPELATDLALHGGDLEFADPDEIAAVADAVEDFRPDIIFIDSMGSTIEGDENKREFTRNARKIARAIREAHPCTVVFIHHWNKPSKERPNKPSSRMSGHASLRAMCSHHLCVERTPENYAKFTVDKNRHGLELPPFMLMPRINNHEGTACFDYLGDAEDRSGQSGATKAVLELLRGDRGPHMYLKDIIAMIPEFSPDMVKRAVGELARSRPPQLAKISTPGKATEVKLLDAPGAPPSDLIPRAEMAAKSASDS